VILVQLNKQLPFSLYVAGSCCFAFASTRDLRTNRLTRLVFVHDCEFQRINWNSCNLMKLWIKFGEIGAVEWTLHAICDLTTFASRSLRWPLRCLTTTVLTLNLSGPTLSACSWDVRVAGIRCLKLLADVRTRLSDYVVLPFTRLIRSPTDDDASVRRLAYRHHQQQRFAAESNSTS